MNALQPSVLVEPSAYLTSCAHLTSSVLLSSCTMERSPLSMPILVMAASMPSIWPVMGAV